MVKRRKARPVSSADYDRSSLIERNKAVRLIAQRIEGSEAPGERTRNRVSHRITEAVKKGTLKAERFGKFRFGELIRFARDTWAGYFTDLPETRNVVLHGVGGVLRVPPLFVQGEGRVLRADTLDGWRDYSARLEAANKELRADNLALFLERDRLRQEVERLRVFEQKAEQSREKKRRAGKKGGRGRSREKQE